MFCPSRFHEFSLRDTVTLDWGEFLRRSSIQNDCFWCVDSRNVIKNRKFSTFFDFEQNISKFYKCFSCKKPKNLVFERLTRRKSTFELFFRYLRTKAINFDYSYDVHTILCQNYELIYPQNLAFSSIYTWFWMIVKRFFLSMVLSTWISDFRSFLFT